MYKRKLEVVQVATVVIDINRLVMKHMGKDIVNISRDLDAVGKQVIKILKLNYQTLESTPFDEEERNNFVGTTKEVLSRLSVASQKGLVERFDSSIENGKNAFSYGGCTYHTETEGMAAFNCSGKETTTASLMAYGYNPKISKWSPYHGAMYAVVESVAKIVAMGGNYHTVVFIPRIF